MTGAAQTLRQTLERAIADALSAHGELPTKWILAAESLGPDGQNGIWLVTSDQISAWDALGLIEYAKFAEMAQMDVSPD